MTNEEDKQPLTNPPKVLGKIGQSERDTTLNQQPASATSHRRGVPAPLNDPASDPDEVLKLPRGALVAMRKSGGLMFSLREVIVYRNGRVVRRGHGSGRARYRDASLLLGEEQLAELALVLSQTTFPRFAGAARHSPDTLVIELAARVKRRLKLAEMPQGGVPESLAPLVGWLEPLLAVGEDDSDSLS